MHFHCCKREYYSIFNNDTVLHIIQNGQGGGGGGRGGGGRATHKLYGNGRFACVNLIKFTTTQVLKGLQLGFGLNLQLNNSANCF